MKHSFMGLATLTMGLFTVPGVVYAQGGLVKLQSADPSCPDASGDIYVDCGNGTVTDNRTGLVWLKNASCFGQLIFRDAADAVAGLADVSSGSPDQHPSGCGLTDGSSPDEWRLPSSAEMEFMYSAADGDASEPECDPAITNDAGDACWSTQCAESGQCSFTAVESIEYWTATPSTSGASVWSASLDIPVVWQSGKGNTYYIWPVRGGQ